METVENIAGPWGIEIKDFFDFAHLDPERVSPEGLEESIKEMDKKSRQLLYRIARVVAR